MCTMLETLVLAAVLCGMQDVKEYMAKAMQASEQGKYDQALALLDKAVAVDPNSMKARAARSAILEKLRRFDEAIKDLTQAIEMAPGTVELIDHRGSLYFMIGKMEESLADFDNAIKLRPNLAAAHWRRGITLYYLGRYAEGRQQFEDYQTVDGNDVENVVWRYLCMARQTSPAQARDAMLGVKLDRRVPMMMILDLFRERSTPDKVLAYANAGKPSPEELKKRLFYAHLYLGLYHEAQGDSAKCMEHMKKAVDDYAVGGYMWDVARVHKMVREKKK